MRRYALVLCAAVCGCAAGPGTAGERPRDTAMVLIAPDTRIDASDREGAELALSVISILDGLHVALENGQVTLRRWAREPEGPVPVPDSAAVPTDFGVLVDSAGRIIGAVVGEPPFTGDARFTTYVFDEIGRTIGIEVAFTDEANGCAELLDVELRWVLRDGNVVQFSRRLKDQDGRGVSVHECLVGAGERRSILRSWTELARSVGWTEEAGGVRWH